METHPSLSIIWSALQGLLLIGVAPLLTGLIAWVKSLTQTRHRPLDSVLMPYRNLLQLFRTPAIYPQDSSWVFRAAPLVAGSAYLWLAFTIPIYFRPLLNADLIVLLYVLAAARFAMALGALDSGAALSGMGAGREMFFQLLMEVGMVPVLAILALRWQTLDLTVLWEALHSAQFAYLQQPTLTLTAVAFALLVLYEIERIPIGQEHGGLELGMGHDALTQEYAGRDLALIELGQSVKLATMMALLSQFFLPIAFLFHGQVSKLTPIASLPLMLDGVVKTGGFLLALVLWESLQPRLRLRRSIRIFFFSLAASLVALSLSLMTGSSL